MVELIIGGARSGKSRYAQQRAASSGKEVVYIATARAHDGEMRERIARHRRERPRSWRTIEEPIQLAKTLRDHASVQRCVLVDCLTLWLSKVLFDKDGTLQARQFQKQRQALLDVLPTLSGEVLLVTNEIGMAVIPATPSARRFVDEAGWLHQELAERCEQVTWVVAGLPQVLKAANQ